MKQHDIEFFSIEELFDFAMTDKTNRRGYVDLGKLSEEEVAKFSEILEINCTEFNRIIDSYSIKHIIKNHGNSQKEEKRGQIAIDKEIIRQIPNLIENADKCYSDGLNKLGRKVIKHEKTDKHTVVIIEEVREHKKLLALDSMRIHKK
jgi:hypothetical protein